MEIWPGIHMLESSRLSNAYLFMGPPVTLIDTGPPGTLPALIAALRRAGVEPEQVRRIVLTHCDSDHIGNAAALHRIGGAEVCAHQDELPYIAGTARLGGLRRLITAALEHWLTRPPVDRSVRNGDLLDGLSVLHLPGHTPGHIGLQAGKALFGGDCLSGGRRPRIAPAVLAWDQRLARHSVERISTLEIDLLMPGHGTPFNDASRRCADLLTDR